MIKIILYIDIGNEQPSARLYNIIYERKCMKRVHDTKVYVYLIQKKRQQRLRVELSSLFHAEYIGDVEKGKSICHSFIHGYRERDTPCVRCSSFPMI